MQYILRLLNSETSSIRNVAKVIGLLVSSFSAVRYGECHYCALEQEKNNALKTAKGNFDKFTQLSSRSVEELNWSLQKLPNSHNLIHFPPVDTSLN